MIRRPSSAASPDHEDITRRDDETNVFSDDYAESSAESYADSVDAQSIRRTSSRSPLPSRRTSLREPPARPLAAIPASLSHHASSHSRASINKTHGLSNDGDRSDARRGISLRPIATNPASQSSFSAMARRSLSSHSSFAGSQSPVSPGADEGPSHPYTMYPQGLGVSRSTSIATASTRPFSHAAPNRPPAHPYGLYTQNIADDVHPDSQQNPIPVGFPGSGVQFHRRIGPEGEEQDIIGSDGHTEQLPPYSRYPEQDVQKTVTGGAPLSAIGEASSPESSRSDNAPAQEPERQDDTPVSTPITSERVPGRAASVSNDTSFSEKSWSEKSWKERRRVKICGTPLWFFVFVSSALVLVTVIIGSVIGGILSRQSEEHHKHKQAKTSNPNYAEPAQTLGPLATQSQTTFIDVVAATTTPSKLQPLPTGVFGFDPGNPIKDSAACLPNNQQAAWSCGLPTDLIAVTIDDTGSTLSMSLTPIVSNDIWYGVQPPVVSDSSLELVTDDQIVTDPYAYQFQTTYTKFVVLHEEQLTLPSSSQRIVRRDYEPNGTFEDKMSPFQGKAIEQDDHPWFCFWPKTFIEALVYVGNNSTVLPQPPPPPPANNSSSNGDKDGDHSDDDNDDPSGSTTPTPTTLTDPLSTYVTSFTAQSLAPGVVITSPPFADGSYLPMSDGHGYPPPASSWSPPLTRRDTTPKSRCPHKLKLEERRLPDDGRSPPPTCTKMAPAPEKGPNKYSPIRNEQGLLVVLQLDEADPPTPIPIALGRRQLIRRQWPNTCYCEWFSPYGTQPSGS